MPRLENGVMAPASTMWLGLGIAAAVGGVIYVLSRDKDEPVTTGTGGTAGNGNGGTGEPTTLNYAARELGGIQVDLSPDDTLVIQVGPNWSVETDYPASAITPASAENGWKLSFRAVKPVLATTWAVKLIESMQQGGPVPLGPVEFSIKIPGINTQGGV